MSEQQPGADRPTGPGGSGHPEIDELAAYAAGDIDAAAADLVRAHLSGCTDCAGDLAAIARTSEQLAGDAEPAMPADVAARLDAAIAGAGASTAVAATVLPGRTRRRTPGWATGAAAAVVLALLAAVAIGTLTRDRTAHKTSATMAAATPAAARGRRYDSGTDYTKAALTAQVNAVLRTSARARLDADASAAAPEAPATSGAAAAGGAGVPFGGASAAPVPATPAPSIAAAASSAAAADATASEAASAAPSASPARTFAAESSAASSGSAPVASASAGSVAAPALPSQAPAADLTALRSDPQRLARCVQSVTDGLTAPTAIDFASFEGRPALAIVLPTATAGVAEVYLVGGECGAGADATVLYYARISTG